MLFHALVIIVVIIVLLFLFTTIGKAIGEPLIAWYHLAVITITVHVPFSRLLLGVDELVADVSQRVLCRLGSRFHSPFLLRFLGVASRIEVFVVAFERTIVKIVLHARGSFTTFSPCVRSSDGSEARIFVLLRPLLLFADTAIVIVFISFQSVVLAMKAVFITLILFGCLGIFFGALLLAVGDCGLATALEQAVLFVFLLAVLNAIVAIVFTKPLTKVLNLTLGG